MIIKDNGLLTVPMKGVVQIQPVAQGGRANPQGPPHTAWGLGRALAVT